MISSVFDGSMRGGGEKPPRVDPNVHAAGAAVLPMHVVVVPADPGHDTAATAPNHRRRRRSVALFVKTTLFTFAFVAAFFGLLLFGVWMNPVVSIDAVSAADLEAAGNNTSPLSFDVAVRLERRWFRLMPDTYTNGTVSVSCAGGAVAARGELRNVTLTAASPSVVTATARAPPAALSGDARERLAGELRRGEVRVDVTVSYDRAMVDPAAPMSHGFRATCTAAASLAGGNSTAACTVVWKHTPNDYKWWISVR